MIKIECSFVFYSLVVETVGLSKGMFPYVKLSKRSSIFLEKYLLHLRCASSQKRCPILGEKFYFSFHFWLHHLRVGSFWTYLLVEIYLYVQNIVLLSYDTDILLQGRPSWLRHFSSKASPYLNMSKNTTVNLVFSAELKVYIF